MCRLSFPAPRFEFVEAWCQVWNPPDFICTVLLWYHWYHGTFNYGSAIKSHRMQGLEDFTRLSNHILNLGIPLTFINLSSWNIEHERRDRKELVVMASHCRRTGSNMFQRILSWCHDLIGISGMCAECATAPCHWAEPFGRRQWNASWDKSTSMINSQHQPQVHMEKFEFPTHHGPYLVLPVTLAQIHTHTHTPLVIHLGFLWPRNISFK